MSRTSDAVLPSLVYDEEDLEPTTVFADAMTTTMCKRSACAPTSGHARLARDTIADPSEIAQTRRLRPPRPGEELRERSEERRRRPPALTTAKAKVPTRSEFGSVWDEAIDVLLGDSPRPPREATPTTSAVVKIAVTSETVVEPETASAAPTSEITPAAAIAEAARAASVPARWRILDLRASIALAVVVTAIEIAAILSAPAADLVRARVQFVAWFEGARASLVR